MKCCSAPSSRRPALPLHPLPPATVCKPKTKLKAKPNKFAPVVKYTTAENQEVKFESLLGEGTEVVLVRKKGAAREGVPPSHGVPSIEPGKKGELWVQVELCPASRPADALAGSKPIAGWVPRDSLRLPSLALNYEYLASELLEEPKRYPAAGSSQCARCNKILAERFLGHVAKVAYPLLGVGGAEVDREWSDAELAGIARAYSGGPAQRKGPARGLRAALTRLEDKFLPAEGEGFLCGAEPCIADLSVAPPLMLLGVAGLPLSEPVQAYVARCEAFFGEKYAAIKAPTQEWVESRREQGTKIFQQAVPDAGAGGAAA